MKDLVGNDLTHPAKLNELNINILNVIHISEETFIFDLLEQFQNGNSKMAFVYKEISKDDSLLLPDDRITIKEDNKGIDEQKEEEKIDGKESLSINDNQFEEELLSNNINKTNKVEENLSEDKTQEKIIKEDKLILDKDSIKKTNREIIGIITLKDLIESLLKIHFHNENEIIRKSIRKSSI